MSEGQGNTTLLVQTDVEIDALIDTINEVLVVGAWSQVAALTPVLAERARTVGNLHLAELAQDMHAIALDALAYPAGDDGVFEEAVAHGISV